MVLPTRINNPQNINFVVAEDAKYIADTVLLGIEWLIGASPENIHYFEEIDGAKEYIEDSDRDQPTVMILDNDTPRSDNTGYGLAMDLLKRKEEFPNLLIITISSSDLGLVTANGGRLIKGLLDAGGEFWAKHAERHLMLLWLGECLRENKLVSRNDWLTGLGLDTLYRDTSQPERKEDLKIDAMLDYMHYQTAEQERIGTLQKNNLQKGDFYNLEAREVLNRLGFLPATPEGQVGRPKESV